MGETAAVPGWGVIPTIRVHDVRAVLDHYRDVLSFTIERDHPENSTVAHGEARIMVEPAGSLYSDEYNAAIRERIGSKPPNALYIESSTSTRTATAYARRAPGSPTRSRRVRGGSASSPLRTPPAIG